MPPFLACVKIKRQHWMVYPWLFDNFVRVMKSDVMGYFKELYEHGSFERSLNAILVLIPEKGWQKI